MRKSRDILRLIRLYLAYHINKIVIIVFSFVLIIWSIVLLLNTGYPLEMDQYTLNSNLFHTNYLEQSIFFLEIIDGVIVAFLVGAELSSLALFDPMLVPNISRIKIIIAKIAANLLIILGIVSLQFLLLEFVGVLTFPKYKFTITDLKMIFFFIFPMIELLLLGELISMLINSYFIPILIFIIHLLFTILMKIEDVKKILLLFIPKIELNLNSIALNGNYSIYFSVCFLLFMGILLLFQRKDICNS